jgi:hypothetical protein
VRRINNGIFRDNKKKRKDGKNDYVGEYNISVLLVILHLHIFYFILTFSYSQLFIYYTNKTLITILFYFFSIETLSYITSLPEQISVSKLDEPISTTSNHQVAMSSTVNYTDSYDSSLSSYLNRTGSSRQYVSSLQHTLAVHAKPVVLTTPITCNVLKRNQPIISNEKYPSIQTSRRLHSSTSLSSTGYDSNSSPSIKSKRNSVATNNSNDFIIHSTCSSSSSSSSSSSDEQPQQQTSKPWVKLNLNNCYFIFNYNFFFARYNMKQILHFILLFIMMKHLKVQMNHHH